MNVTAFQELKNTNLDSDQFYASEQLVKSVTKVFQLLKVAVLRMLEFLAVLLLFFLR